jgi:hypothetical protein
MDESMGAITILGVDQSLRDAAKQGNIDAMYSLIRSDAKVLHRIDEIPFIETPLHTAASAGQIQFAMEIMRLKPSFARKLNARKLKITNPKMATPQCTLHVAK